MVLLVTAALEVVVMAVVVQVAVATAEAVRVMDMLEEAQQELGVVAGRSRGELAEVTVKGGLGMVVPVVVEKVEVEMEGVAPAEGRGWRRQRCGWKGW